MKKLITYSISLFLVLGVNSLAMAQVTSTQSTTTQATTTQVTLPPAGLTPDSPFYFLNQFREAVQMFFTFNPEAKAKLEVSFASERVAEIKAVISTKGVQDKAVAVAETSLQNSLSNAAKIVAAEKSKGNDVSQLANSLNDQIAQNKELLSQVFDNQKNALDVKIEELKTAASDARSVGSATTTDALAQQIQDLKTQQDLLDKAKQSQENAIDSENAKIEDQMNAKDEAAKKIQEVKDGRDEIVYEAQKNGISIPAETFSALNDFLAKAQAAFDAGNYDDARNFARQAKDSLHNISTAYENLKEAKSNESQINTDQQGLLQEASQAQSEQAKEAIKKAQEQLMEDQKNALEQTKKAQEQLIESQKKALEKAQEDAKNAQEQSGAAGTSTSEGQ